MYISGFASKLRQSTARPSSAPIRSSSSQQKNIPQNNLLSKNIPENIHGNILGNVLGNVLEYSNKSTDIDMTDIEVDSEEFISNDNDDDIFSDIRYSDKNNNYDKNNSNNYDKNKTKEDISTCFNQNEMNHKFLNQYDNPKKKNLDNKKNIERGSVRGSVSRLPSAPVVTRIRPSTVNPRSRISREKSREKEVEFHSSLDFNQMNKDANNIIDNNNDSNNNDNYYFQWFLHAPCSYTFLFFSFHFL